MNDGYRLPETLSGCFQVACSHALLNCFVAFLSYAEQLYKIFGRLLLGSAESDMPLTIGAAAASFY